VSSTEGAERTVFVHWAPRDVSRLLDPGAWSTEAIPATRGEQMWMFATPFDADGENGIDLVIGSRGGGASVSWLESPADPRRLGDWRLHGIVEAGWIMSIRAAGDHLLVSDRRGDRRSVYRLDRRAPGVFERVGLLGAHREWMFLDAIEGGVAVATRNGVIVVSAAGTTHAVENPLGVPWGKAVAVGDVDLDGRPDVVHSANTGEGGVPGLTWLRFDGALGVGTPRVHDVSGLEGVKFDRLELIDLDGDGDLDVLTCEENAGPDSTGLGVIWYENPTR
jgi:hypothetical protein